MRFGAPFLLFCMMLGAAVATASPACAEDVYPMSKRNAVPTVKDHVRRAQKARDAGRWAEAHAAYRAAFEAAVPASSTERERAEIAGELGLCELALRRYRDAAEHLAWSLEQRDALPVEQQLRFEAGQREVAPYVGTLYLSVEPPDAEVLIDGKPVGGPARIYRVFLEPGQHMVRARLAGHEDAFLSFEALAGKATSFSMQVPRAVAPGLVAKDAATGRRDTKGSAREAQASSDVPSPVVSKLRIAGAVVAGVTMAAGGGLLIWSASTEDELRDQATALRGADQDASRCARPNAPRACSELRDLQGKRDLLRDAGWVTLASGGVLGVLTLASLLVGRPSSPGDGVHIVPTVNGQQAGLMMIGAW